MVSSHSSLPKYTYNMVPSWLCGGFWYFVSTHGRLVAETDAHVFIPDNIGSNSSIAMDINAKAPELDAVLLLNIALHNAEDQRGITTISGAEHKVPNP